MKTDRFSDIIRRKLESIRPEFTDKDWTRMQATLQQAAPPQPGTGTPNPAHPFSGGVWSGTPWLLAAATVSTVVLIAFSIWQRSEINHLRETIGQLKQQATPTQVTPTVPTQEQPTVTKTDGQNQPGRTTSPFSATDQKPVAHSRPDTVYVTRYVDAPSRSRREAPEGRSVRRMDTPPTEHDVLTSRTPVPTDGYSLPVTPDNTSKPTDKPIDYGVSSTPLTSAPNTINPLAETNKNKSGNRPNQRVPESQVAANQAIKTANSYQTADGSNQRNESKGNPGRQAGQTTDYSTAQSESGTAIDLSNRPAMSLELATSHPLSTKKVNWNTLVAQRARRMRSIFPAPSPTVAPVVAPEKAPTSQPVQQIAAKVRVGLGTEFDAHTWSVGLFTQVPLSRHWMLGMGLSQATYMGGLFITADDFDSHTHRDFKQEIGRGLDPKLDPKGDILNVDTRMVRVQVPLSLSYRVPLSRTLTLLPMVGTYLNFSSTERIAFYYRQNQRGFDQANFSASRPVNFLNTVALGTGLEWQSRHWVVQGSPVLTLPMQSDPSWQKDPSLNLRFRVLYQF